LTFVYCVFNGVLLAVNAKLVALSWAVSGSVSCCNIKKLALCPHSSLCAPCDSYNGHLLFSHTLLL